MSEQKNPPADPQKSPLTSAGQIPTAPPQKPDKPRVVMASADPLSDGVDMTLVDPESLDPDMHYRFAYESSNRLSRLYAMGYRTVKRSEDGVKLLYDMQQGAAEDLIRIGDTVMVCIPKKIHNERRARRDRLREARLSAPEGQFRKKAAKANVPITDREMNSK